MKRDEADELLRRRTEAAEEHNRLLRASLEAPERRRRRAELDLLYPPPRRLLHGERGGSALLSAVPALGAGFRTVVPESNVAAVRGRDGSQNRILICPCGSLTLLPEVGFAFCSGSRCDDDDNLDPTLCTRIFLATPRDVRVKRVELERAA